MRDPNTVVLDTIEKLLEVPLDEDQVRERADLAAQLSARIEDAREAKALAAKEAKAAIDEMSSDMRKALREVRFRRVEAPIECEVVLTPSERSVSIVRKDTGEVLSTRPARESELQIELVPPARGRKRRGAADE